MNAGIPAAALEALRGLPASAVYEANGRHGDLSPDIRPLFEGARLVGPAFTVKCWPGDLTAMRRAVDGAAPGDVLVIDVGGPATSTAWGGSAAIVAQRRGLAGVVTNGTTRDTDQIREMRFPVFCAGASVRGGAKSQPGWTGIPIAIGGVVVHPGDLVLADSDGVVVVGRSRLETVLQAAIEYQRKSDLRVAQLRAGAPYAQ
jgi:4-hydroxy-4-methyl-2-oxoglutarate aldolase